MTVTKRALALAATGIPVFPCNATKSPSIPASEGGQGFRDASTDPARVREMFDRPGAALIGMPTGLVSGIDVLDLDPRHGSDAWPDRARLPMTRTRRTGSGGQHFMFRHAPGLGCSVERIAPGVDVRADGGYVILWPDENAAPVADWPGWLLDAALAVRRSSEAGDVSHIEVPPNAAAVIDLFDRLPNPAENNRGVWTDVMLAATGCAFALDDATGVAEAACRWAARWPSSPGYDVEMAKWQSDWSRRDRPLAGWRHLASRANREIEGYATERAVAEFEASPLPPEPAPTVLPVRGGSMRDRFVFPADCQTGPRRGYLIKHLVAPGDVCAIIGPPSCGKSMLAPYLAYAVAQGRDVFGLRTKKERTLYVAAEDATGMRQRIHALKITHDDAPNFAMVDVGSLRDPATASDLVAAVKDWKPALVVIDTLGAAFAGMDENSASDMGEVVALARSLANHGCAVMLVHHIAKHGDGSPRGHSVLNGTLDLCLSLTPRGEDGVIRGSLLKNRNGTTDRSLLFRFVAVALGIDEDGDAITAPMAVEIDANEQRAALAKLSPINTRALEILHVAIDGQGDDQDGHIGVTETVFRDACEDQRLSASDEPKSRLKVVAKCIQQLLAAGRIGAGSGRFWIVEPSGTSRNQAEPSGTNWNQANAHTRGTRNQRNQPTIGGSMVPVPEGERLFTLMNETGYEGSRA